MPVIAAIFIVLFAMLVEALGVTAVGMAFFDTGFVDGWNTAWDKPLMLLAFALIALLFRSN